MKQIAIWTHQGLGDLIICNAIFRHAASRYDLVVIPVKYPNTESVTFMLRDLENVIVRPVVDDADGIAYMRDVQDIPEWETLFLGGCGDNFQDSDFDRSFYRQAHLPFELRWDGWKALRDEDAEITIPESKFAFIHGDTSRGFSITRTEHIHERLVRFRPIRSATNNIFAYMNALKEASEIHCIDSSFALLADSVCDNPNQTRFIHRYARPSHTIPTYKHNWIILT